MGVLVIPLSIWGLSFLGLSFLIGVLLLVLIDKAKMLRFLSENKRITVVMVLSMAIGALLIFKIWTYFHFPWI